MFIEVSQPRLDVFKLENTYLDLLASTLTDQLNSYDGSETDNNGVKLDV